MAYNSMVAFDFDYFDQVGSLSNLLVNMSHNRISQLADNNSMYALGRGEHASQSCHIGVISHSNIKLLDLSHNNITRISNGFFRPGELSLSHLYLGHNSITNATRDIIGNLVHLHCLDLSHNLLREIDYDTFRSTKKLQVIDLSHNTLFDIPSDLFKSIKNLRIIDLSHNSLRGLPDNLFVNDGMESLDLSHNSFSKIPIVSLSNLAALTMCEIDLSHNLISAIHTMDLSNKLRSLSKLNLSYNRLFQLNDAVFATLPRLSFLDLSHNSELKVMDKAFVGLENTLIKLNLENVSLSTVPDLPLPMLRELRLAHNELPSILQDLSHNMTSLRLLDLSENDLTNMPVVMRYLPQLRSLSLAGNSIKSLVNNSFFGTSDKLEHLDISRLELNTFELGTLKTLPSLRSLRISPYPGIKSFNIPNVIEDLDNLRDLWIDEPYQPKVISVQISDGSSIGKELLSPVTHIQMTVSSDLNSEMIGLLPSKVRTLTISGKSYNQLADYIFNGIQSPFVHIIFFNTSLSTLSPNIFRNMGQARNVSLDFRHFNQKLSKIPNPNTATKPNLPEKIFLTDIRMADLSLNCDCGIGWIEYWQRKKRQYLCENDQLWSDSHSMSSVPCSKCSGIKEIDCHWINDDLRRTTCSNKNRQQLIEVLKSELECGWGSSATTINRYVAFSIVAVIFVIWF